MSLIQITEQNSLAKAEAFIARQPILDHRQNTFGHELLYRSSHSNAFNGTDSTKATLTLLSDSFLTFGLDRLVGDRKAFINFDRQTLLSGYPAMLPRDKVVVEILETVRPDPQIIEVCETLKRAGYLLALDDFVCADGFEPLLDLADIVKVDFRLATGEQIVELVRRVRNRPTLLAEKVETQEEFCQARDLGFRLFQGYFFSRPVIMSRRQIPGYKLNYLRILKEVSKPDMDFARIENEVKGEASVIHKLLRYVNSAYFGQRYHVVNSIRHALELLGEIEVRKWISIAVLGGLAADKPQQLIVEALMRGRFCELMSGHVGLGERSSELFLLGLYSLINALLDCPMEEVVDEVPLGDDVRGTLLGRPVQTPGLSELLTLVKAFQWADWSLLDTTAAALRLPPREISASYLDAVQWADEIFQI